MLIAQAFVVAIHLVALFAEQVWDLHDKPWSVKDWVVTITFFALSATVWLGLIWLLRWAARWVWRAVDVSSR